MQAFERTARTLPEYLSRPLLALSAREKSSAQEIRLYRGGYAAIFFGQSCRFLSAEGVTTAAPSSKSLAMDKRALEEVFLMLCGFSVQTHEFELVEGYFTTAYGDRVGVGFSAAYSPEGSALREVSSLNIRISREMLSSGRDILNKVDISGGLLLAGAPCSGKTTMLRDIVRRISSGLAGDIRKVTLIDERYELSSGRDTGFCTDVIAGIPKAAAMLQAVRTLSPQLIACDEIGSPEEARGVAEGVRCGVAFIATVHCGSAQEMRTSPVIRTLMDTNAFANIALLRGAAAPGMTAQIIGREKYYDKDSGAAAGICRERNLRLCACRGAERGKAGAWGDDKLFPAISAAAARTPCADC